MDQQHDFVVVEEDGVRKVWIDNEEVTGEITGLEIHMPPGQATALMLYATPDSLKIVDRGYIYVQPVVDGTVLNDLDPFEIEQMAMERESWGSDKRFVENLLDVIKEKLSGQTP